MIRNHEISETLIQKGTKAAEINLFHNIITGYVETETWKIGRGLLLLLMS